MRTSQAMLAMDPITVMPLDHKSAALLREGKLKAREKAVRDLEAAEEAGDAKGVAEARRLVRELQREIRRFGLDD